MKKFKITNHFIHDVEKLEHNAEKFDEMSEGGWEFESILTTSENYCTTLWSKQIIN